MKQLCTLVDNIHETTGAIKEYHTKNNSSSGNLNSGIKQRMGNRIKEVIRIFLFFNILM
jgi:hypothetical protein